MSGYVGVAPGTTTFQDASGKTIMLVDWIDDKHYASVQWVNGGNSSLVVFSSGKSQPIVGGTRTQLRTDCNLPRNGDSGLPNAWEFLVYAIAIEVMRVTRTSGSNSNPLATDYSEVSQLAVWFGLNRSLFCEYKYSGKVYCEGLMEDFPSGAGPSFQGTATQREMVLNGGFSPRDRVALVLPLHEREGNGYAMTLYPEIALVISQTPVDSTTALTFADMRVRKLGLIKRPVN